jgi:hypothetical protein
MEVFQKMGGAEVLLKWAQNHPEVFTNKSQKYFPRALI